MWGIMARRGGCVNGDAVRLPDVRCHLSHGRDRESRQGHRPGLPGSLTCEDWRVQERASVAPMLEGLVTAQATARRPKMRTTPARIGRTGSQGIPAANRNRPKPPMSSARGGREAPDGLSIRHPARCRVWIPNRVNPNPSQRTHQTVDIPCQVAASTGRSIVARVTSKRIRPSGVWYGAKVSPTCLARMDTRMSAGATW